MKPAPINDLVLDLSAKPVSPLKTLLKRFPAAVILMALGTAILQAPSHKTLAQTFFGFDWLNPATLFVTALLILFTPLIYVLITLCFKKRRTMASVLGIYSKWSRFLIMLYAILIGAQIILRIIQ